MHIDIIDTVERFNGIRGNWDAVYDADPEAQFFLSWMWISEYLDKINRPWFVLAVRPAQGKDYVAFFPLRLRTKVRTGGIFHNEIMMAGNMAADYTGFICDPEFERQAVEALARHLNAMHWATLQLENICLSAGRKELFLRHFPASQFDFRSAERINPDGTNNRICPYVNLPATWDQYLTTLSANTRQKIRRFLRRMDEPGEFRITHADHATFEQDLAALLAFWDLRWRPLKKSRTDGLIAFNRTMLTACFKAGSLFLPVLWHGERRLAALAVFVDRQKHALLFHMAGRDGTFDSPPPGFILHAHSLRYAIANQFRTYHFLKGNEPYKYLFGSEERIIECLYVSTKSKRNLGGKLDPRSLPIASARANKLHLAGKLADAGNAYRQILENKPKDADALYGLGEILFGKADYANAASCFKALTRLRPDSWRAWFRVGQCSQSQRRFMEAARAYREAALHRPDRAVIHYNLSVALQALGKAEEASAAFREAIRLQPNIAAPQRVALRGNATLPAIQIPFAPRAGESGLAQV